MAMQILATMKGQFQAKELLRRCRGFSQVADRETIAHEIESPIPKMPLFDYAPPPYDGPSAAEILQKRKQFLSPSMYLTLSVGLLRCAADTATPMWSRQLSTKPTAYSTPPFCTSTPPSLISLRHLRPSCPVISSMMMARLYTGCHDIISLRNAYHGNGAGTMGATAQSNWKFNIVQLAYTFKFLCRVIFGIGDNYRPYRGVFGSDGKMYAKDVEELITYGTSGHVAGFFSESIQGVGGIVELAPGYLPAVYSSIKKAGGLCIADEVQCGFARTGSHFWGFESQGVVPDIVTMAKGIGNGIPLGAVVTTPEIAEVLTRRSYFNTFGGNPVCTAAGHAVLKVIEKENLQENAHVVGSYLKERLNSLKDKHEIIGDVRGRGLMLGVELVTDRQLKTPAKVETLHVMDQMKEMGVLIGKGGIFGNVFRITPPLCFSKEDAG
ncbi:hypothetical protein C3L33_20545, partial [Rhododendron williamsianum]